MSVTTKDLLDSKGLFPPHACSGTWGAKELVSGPLPFLSAKPVGNPESLKLGQQFSKQSDRWAHSVIM